MLGLRFDHLGPDAQAHFAWRHRLREALELAGMKPQAFGDQELEPKLQRHAFGLRELGTAQDELCNRKLFLQVNLRRLFRIV